MSGPVQQKTYRAVMQERVQAMRDSHGEIHDISNAIEAIAELLDIVTGVVFSSDLVIGLPFIGGTPMPSCTECGTITTTVCPKCSSTSAPLVTPPADPTMLTMLDALKYIQRDPRFHARAKYWQPEISVRFKSPEGMLEAVPAGTPFAIFADHLNEEWEIVRPVSTPTGDPKTDAAIKEIIDVREAKR